ncbi:MAG: PhnD/SsuA/transferrin family substrate-binding protein [Bacteriovoracaceae bacterium]|nr:PhnD/SsuA/transferrin family substrate-binding protein [Bacteriovoracaceae bacterium]
MKIIVSIWICLLISTSVFAEKQILFGVYAFDNPIEIIKKFRPLLDIIESKLQTVLKEDIKIKIHVNKSYEGGIDDLVNGIIHFSRLGPVSYVKAKKKNPKLKILAVESKKGSKNFSGIIAVKSNAKIYKISDLNGKRFAFGNKLSTIGRYLSQQILLKNGIRAKNLSSYSYLGRHDKVGISVASGEYDAGALKENTYNKLIKKGRKLKTLSKFSCATNPWVASTSLSPKIADALRQILLEFNDPILQKNFKKDGFLTGSDKDFQKIRYAIRNNNAFFL